jgi:hypothetical protein
LTNKKRKKKKALPGKNPKKDYLGKKKEKSPKFA